MPPTRLLTQTATIHHVTETGVDVYNDPTTTETTIDSPCLMQQTRRLEATAGGLVETEVLVLFLPADADVEAIDYVTVDGVDYQLDGPPAPWFNPRTRTTSHIEATVRRVA